MGCAFSAFTARSQKILSIFFIKKLINATVVLAPPTLNTLMTTVVIRPNFIINVTAYIFKSKL